MVSLTNDQKSILNRDTNISHLSDSNTAPSLLHDALPKVQTLNKGCSVCLQGILFNWHFIEPNRIPCFPLGKNG